MENEIELYLLKRIKELESENAYLIGKLRGYESIEERAKECRERFFKDLPYQSIQVDNSKSIKEEAFDKLVELLGLTSIHWVEKDIYQLKITSLSGAYITISKENYELFKKAILSIEREEN